MQSAFRIIWNWTSIFTFCYFRTWRRWYLFCLFKCVVLFFFHHIHPSWLPQFGSYCPPIIFAWIFWLYPIMAATIWLLSSSNGICYNSLVISPPPTRHYAMICLVWKLLYRAALYWIFKCIRFIITACFLCVCVYLMFVLQSMEEMDLQCMLGTFSAHHIIVRG